MKDREDLPDWERLLAAERHLQALVPGAVLVGGTAAALHARHRRSMDGDHVVSDLRARFPEVLAELEAAAGWRTARVLPPVLILGSLDGILTGIRQLRRSAPLETEQVDGLVVPTLAEMARVKAWLLATRGTTRDYLDLVVLLERLGSDAGPALSSLDALYPQGEETSTLGEVVERLAEGAPTDAAKVNLAAYKGLVAPWNDLSHVIATGRRWATILAGVALGEP
jgi:hypothetical protein